MGLVLSLRRKYLRRNRSHRRAPQICFDTFVEVCSFLKRGQLARLQTVNGSLHRLVDSHFSQKPFVVFRKFRLMWREDRFIGYRIYRTSTTQHPSDPVLDALDCPRFVRFTYADIVIRTLQSKSHFGEVLRRLIDDDVLENATISIACLLHVFPTRQHVGSFLRAHVLPTDGQCAKNGKFRILELWGDHVPRIRTENESDVPLLGLLANLSDIGLRFSSSVYNDSNYRLQIARSLDESAGFADTTDEAEYGLGLIVSLDEIIWWLERDVTTVQRRPRHLYVTQSTMNCIDNWFTIVQLVTLLRESFEVATSGGTEYRLEIEFDRNSRNYPEANIMAEFMLENRLAGQCLVLTNRNICFAEVITLNRFDQTK